VTGALTPAGGKGIMRKAGSEKSSQEAIRSIAPKSFDLSKNMCFAEERVG